MYRLCIAVITALLLSTTTQARDNIQTYSIEEALNANSGKSRLGDRVKFYFADQTYGSASRKFGEYRTNKKTNALNKSDAEACRWVFLSALLALRDRAIKEGANAVVNIRSNYKNQIFASRTEYQCGAGSIMAGVALVADLVELK